MNVTKTLLYTAVAGTFLASCKSSIITIPVPQGAETAINIPAKKAPLTESAKQMWSHLDLVKDSIPGMSVAKAYQFVADKKGKQVIVAVADSGTDIEHEDLKAVAWVNPKEVAGNAKDDDNNGYVDDVHGWNFLGNAAGKMVHADQLEITRIVKKGMQRFGDKKAADIAQEDKTDYEAFLKIKENFDARVKEKKAEIVNLKGTKQRLTFIEKLFNEVKAFSGKKELTLEVLKTLKTDDKILSEKIANVTNMYQRGMTEKGLQEYKEGLTKYLDSQVNGESYNLDFNARQTLGDDLYDITDAFYGNNNVIGSKDKESHGSHVSGIIAAVRNNNVGIQGVANNVRLMSVRVVPDGDEHDKDVALGIRYAVDNGAKIINTSFGKGFSPNKEWVYDAIKYAAKNDVLIVNAAGNDGKNIDVTETYPNDTPNNSTEISDNVLTVGAMSLNYNEKLPASFSNYGKKM
jgi:Subtilisin-like serine proteases